MVCTFGCRTPSPSTKQSKFELVLRCACSTMASPAALPVMDAALAQLAAKPTSCCDMRSPRADSMHVKDASKRKRVNRNAKLKQCKLDARREQWLSQVNNKYAKADQEPEIEGSHAEDNNDDPGEVVLPEEHSTLERTESRHLALDSSERIETASPRSHLRIKRPEDCDKESSTHDLSEIGESSSSTNSCMSDCSEADSSPKSCGDKSPKSKVTRRGRDFRGVRGMPVDNKFEEGCSDTERTRKGGKENGNLANFSNTSGSTAYGNGIDESGHSVDSEDDWEAAADALDLKPPRDKVSNLHQASDVGEENGRVGSQSVAAFTDREISGNLKPECRIKPSLQSGIVRSSSGKAWRPDDICRPTSLPSLSKQQSLPAHFACQQQRSPIQKDARDPPPDPLQCPICTEELDSTDSDFVPCSCGFRLCLFCHHRIASEDGRCPGCRKFYSTDLPAKPALPSTIRM